MKRFIGTDSPLSFDFPDGTFVKRNQINPKTGIHLVEIEGPRPDLDFRLVYGPTKVIGNILFDDPWIVDRSAPIVYRNKTLARATIAVAQEQFSPFQVFLRGFCALSASLLLCAFLYFTFNWSFTWYLPLITILPSFLVLWLIALLVRKNLVGVGFDFHGTYYLFIGMKSNEEEIVLIATSASILQTDDNMPQGS